MKLSKEDLKKKLSEKITDNDDLVIELLEDVDDSFSENEADSTLKEELEEVKKENEELKANVTDLKTKYKERFLSNPVKEESPEITEEKDEEEKIIDVKEI